MDSNETVQPVPQGDAPSQALNSETPNAVPYTRFKEVNDKMRALEAQLAALQNEQQKQREKELAEQQRWQELAQTLQTKLEEVEKQAQRAADLEASLRATVAARVERLPESVRTLVPEYPDPRLTLEWLNRNEALLLKPSAPSVDAGVAGDAGAAKPTVKLTELELLIARKAGMTPEQYARRKMQGEELRAGISSASEVLRKLEEQGHLSG